MLVMEVETRYTTPFFLKKKSEALPALKFWLERVKNSKGMYPITILIHGGELDSIACRDFCKEKGIHLVVTAAKASNQNPFCRA